MSSDWFCKIHASTVCSEKEKACIFAGYSPMVIKTFSSNMLESCLKMWLEFTEQNNKGVPSGAKYSSHD